MSSIVALLVASVLSTSTSPSSDANPNLVLGGAVAAGAALEIWLSYYARDTRPDGDRFRGGMLALNSTAGGAQAGLLLGGGLGVLIAAMLPADDGRAGVVSFSDAELLVAGAGIVGGLIGGGLLGYARRDYFAEHGAAYYAPGVVTLVLAGAYAALFAP